MTNKSKANATANLGEVVNQETKVHTVSASEQARVSMNLTKSLSYLKENTIGAKFSNIMISYLFDEEAKFKSMVEDIATYLKNNYRKTYKLKSIDNLPADREAFKIDKDSLVLILNTEIAPSIEQQINQRSEILEILLPASDIDGLVNRLSKVKDFLKYTIVQGWNKKSMSIKGFESDYATYIEIEEEVKTKTKSTKATKSISSEFDGLVAF